MGLGAVGDASGVKNGSVTACIVIRTPMLLCCESG